MEHRTKQNQIVAFGLTLCLTAVLLLSTFFVLVHADHDCAGAVCEICSEIEVCIESVHHMAEATLGTGADPLVAPLLLCALLPIWMVLVDYKNTLVSLKVRLND